ncbi:MAG: hypothetical protein ACREUB_11675 [Burkholderiales bacterium]
MGAIAVVLYYAYKGVTEEDNAPTCRGAYADCQKNCRRTRTDTSALQSCQDFCQREADECERRKQ